MVPPLSVTSCIRVPFFGSREYVLSALTYLSYRRINILVVGGGRKSDGCESWEHDATDVEVRPRYFRAAT